jgi:hypothetical protein
MTSSTKSVKCVRDWRDFSLDYYRLPRCGNQWRRQAEKLMHFAEYLSTFADGDGTSIEAGVDRMVAKFRVDRSTIFRWLADLRELRSLAPKSGLTGRYGTAVRMLTRDAFVARDAALMESQTLDSEGHGVASPKGMESQTVDPEVMKSQTLGEFATLPVESINREAKQEQHQHQVLLSGQESVRRKTQTPDVTSEALPPLTDQSKTLGQQFDLRYHPGFNVLAPGLSTATKQWQEFAGATDLLCLCWDVVTDFADQPYRSVESEAFVMDAAMKRFTARGDRVPPAWMKIMHDLRREIQKVKSSKQESTK